MSIHQDLRESGWVHVKERDEGDTSSGKMKRFGMASHYILDGRVLFPESAPYLDDFFDELAAFPNGSHDDQVDSMTQIVAYFQRVINLALARRRPVDL